MEENGKDFLFSATLIVALKFCWKLIATVVWLEKFKNFLMLTSPITVEAGFEAFFDEKREENADAVHFKGCYKKNLKYSYYGW